MAMKMMIGIVGRRMVSTLRFVSSSVGRCFGPDDPSPLTPKP